LLIIGMMVLSGIVVTPLQIADSNIPVQQLYQSPFASIPPTIDGVVSSKEWENAVKIQLNYGWLMIQNDVLALYLLIDLTEDTIEDSRLETGNADDFLLTFDTDLDGKISGIDLNYAPIPGTNTLGMQQYIEPGELGGLGPTGSQLGVGFGESINSRGPHRIWELAICLSEIKSDPTGSVRLGLMTTSPNPSFSDERPQNFTYEFSNLLQITLNTKSLDLLILSDETFITALQPLKTHKDNTDILTSIQSWQSLNKTLETQGQDVQERIKKGIADYEEYCDINYVMLVGDIDKFPTRFCKSYNTEHGTMFYPSDLYYADLYDSSVSFDDWDYDNDGFFGEMDFKDSTKTYDYTINIDRIDMKPDVMVGRIPASLLTWTS